MSSHGVTLFVVLVSVVVFLILDAGNHRTGVEGKKSKASKTNRNDPTDKNETKRNSSRKCPSGKLHTEDFLMKMGLCRPNSSVVCTAKPDYPCYRRRSKLKATAFVQRRITQCTSLVESNVTSRKSLKFYVEAKRVINPNAEGSRSIAEPEEHQRGKCLLKYVCEKRTLKTVTMECGTVIADEHGNLSNFTKQRSMWIAPPSFTDYIYFLATISVTEDKRSFNIDSTKIYAPGGEYNLETTTDQAPTQQLISSTSSTLNSDESTEP